MPYPPDIILPGNAKYFGFIDPKLEYDSNWDINWSFQYSIVGTQQHAFCTFLTTLSSAISALPGQYLGYLGNAEYLLDENGEYILTEDGERILLETSSDQEATGILAIAFDSTGLFALSSSTNPGVGLSQIKENALIIRDNEYNVIFNECLSSLNTNFIFASSVKHPQTLRFRFSNGNKISIDFKTETTEYINLTSVSVDYNLEAFDKVYVGFSYVSPVSSATATPSTLYLKNFHTQGNTSDPTIENTVFSPLTSTRTSQYTTLSGVSAYKVYIR
jgi:hypothetical protein